MPLFRSLLFAPGNHPRRWRSASASTTPDVVILDLEDAGRRIAEKETTGASSSMRSRTGPTARGATSG